MESVNSVDLNMLLNVLMVSEEHIRVLEASLNGSSTHVEHCRQVQATIMKAISMANYMKSNGQVGHHVACPTNVPVSESPVSNSGSPRSEISERAFKEHERREMCKKRKTMPKWTQKICLSPTGGGDSLDDGYSWRKYGQKDILGAKHPRGYYRCTYRNTIGCLAIKQVQKCDDDPTSFDITYRGEHTCSQKPKPPPQTQTLDQTQTQTVDQNYKQQQLLLNFQANLKVKTEGLDNTFSFPSTPINSFTTPESNLFSASSTPENNFVGSFSSPFISPATTTATSESNYFSLSGCNNYVGNANVAFNYTGCESDLTEIISGATSTSNSPLMDIGFLDHVADHFDSSYAYDASTDYFGSLL